MKVNFKERTYTDPVWSILYIANVAAFLACGLTFVAGSKGPMWVLEQNVYDADGDGVKETSGLVRNRSYDGDFRQCCASLQGKDLSPYGQCPSDGGTPASRRLEEEAFKGRTRLPEDAGIFDTFGAAPQIPVLLVLAVVFISVGWIALLRVAAKPLVAITELAKVAVCVWLANETSNVVFYIIAGLYLAVVAWKYKNILFATRIIEHGALALKSNPTMFFSIIGILAVFVCHVFLFIFFVSRFVNFVTVEPVVTSVCLSWSTTDGSTPGDGSGYSPITACDSYEEQYDCGFAPAPHKGDLLWVLIFTYIWSVFWYSQVRLYVVALIVGSWHWHPQDKPGACQALGIVMTKGVGTSSLSALLLAIIEQIKRETKFKCWHIFSPVHLVLCAMGWLCVTCMSMLTKYTLIVHAFSGQTFFQSGKNSYHLMCRHFTNGLVTEAVSKNLLFLASLVFSFGIYVVSWVWMDDEFGTTSFKDTTAATGSLIGMIILEGILIWYPCCALIIFILIDDLVKAWGADGAIVAISAMVVGVIASMLFNFVSGVILDAIDVSFVLFAVDKDNGIDLSANVFAQQIVKYIPNAKVEFLAPGSSVAVGLPVGQAVGQAFALPTPTIAAMPQQPYVGVGADGKHVLMGQPGTIVQDPTTGQLMMMVPAQAQREPEIKVY